LRHLAPNGNRTRGLTIAKGKIEEATMWAIKGVAVTGRAGELHQRAD